MAKLTYLFHAGIYLELGSLRLLFDPFTGKSIKNKEVKNSFDYSKLRDIDYVFVTHEHQPHCDRQFLDTLAEKYGTKIVAPSKVISLISNFKQTIEVSTGDEFDLGDLRVKVVKAVHPQSAYPVGYILTHNQKRYYFTGDTYKFSDAYKHTCDILIAPIGGTYTMDPYDASIFARDVKAKYFIPVHYNSYDKIKQNPKEIVDYLESAWVTPIILEPGKSVMIKA